jgi:hypothetical protein
MDGVSTNRWRKLGVVLGGYALALLMSGVAVAIYDRRFTPRDNATMGGMIAGGEMMYFIGLFLLGALPPTGLGLWFLRRHRPSWSVFTTLGLGFAVAGLVSVLALLVQTAVPPLPPWLLLVDVFSIGQMLGSPLFIAGFGLFALLAPARDLRVRMLMAAGIEVLVFCCGLVHFLLPRLAF